VKERVLKKEKEKERVLKGKRKRKKGFSREREERVRFQDVSLTSCEKKHLESAHVTHE